MKRQSLQAKRLNKTNRERKYVRVYVLKVCSVVVLSHDVLRRSLDNPGASRGTERHVDAHRVLFVLHLRVPVAVQVEREVLATQGDGPRQIALLLRQALAARRAEQPAEVQEEPRVHLGGVLQEHKEHEKERGERPRRRHHT